MRAAPLLLLLLLGCRPVDVGSAAHAQDAQAATVLPADVRVIDGDTLVLRGETIRVENIDAPEAMPRSRCWAEARLAREATFALELAVANWAIIPPVITRSGKDQYGRTLATLQSPGGEDIGEELIKSGLAVAWTGRRWDWCGPVSDAAAGATLLTARPSPLASAF